MQVVQPPVDTRTGATKVTDPDYDVTGDGSPSPNGEYYYAGEYGGKPCYRRADGAYEIWWSIEHGEWTLSVQRGETLPGSWSKIMPITGNYTADPPYTGIATVTEH